MATESRKSDSSLTSELFQEPYKFSFFQAVRVLEKIYQQRKPVGKDCLPENEIVRFHSRNSLNFPASEIFQLTNQDGQDGQTEMTVAFMGMAGLMGALPTSYTELLIDCKHRKDFAFREFLDLFNHRLISLFYRAFEKYRFPIAFERDGADLFTRSIYSLIGMGTRGLANRMSVPDKALIYYSGLIAQRPHSASALLAILKSYFQINVEIVQFFGQWLKLDAESHSKLGAANCQLGLDIVAGTKVWNSQSKFRLQLGPLTYSEFQQFLPIGTAYQQICDLVRFQVGLEMDFDIQLLLKAEEVPDLIISTKGEQAKLGWTTWLKTKPFSSPDGQVVLATKNK